ncbi:hypothetical protein SESBI_17301 [Sesbania bispinosa]|nr:hypothetical protein SESBI_17301 [Sesbania bispinosa]
MKRNVMLKKGKEWALLIKRINSLSNPNSNISKDAVVGVDQKSDGFWLRITNTYNEHHCALQERKEGQLKSRWKKLNVMVQKFYGCYKQACSVKQSGSSKSDIMATAYEIYMKDEVVLIPTFRHTYKEELIYDKGKLIANFKQIWSNTFGNVLDINMMKIE